MHHTSRLFLLFLSVPSGPPQNLAVLSRTTTSITLTWSDPALDRINDRDGVTGFVVRRNGVQVANVTVQTYTFTGLSVATSYNFEVLAVNDQGTAPNNHAARLTATTDYTTIGPVIVGVKSTLTCITSCVYIHTVYTVYTVAIDMHVQYIQ